MKKTKLKDRMVTVLVLGVLNYSLDGIRVAQAVSGDLIDIPLWMAEGLEKKDLVSQDIEDPEEESTGYSLEELKDLTETDFAEMEKTEIAEWAKEHLDLTIAKNCKIETATAKIFEHIEAMTEED